MRSVCGLLGCWLAVSSASAMVQDPYLTAFEKPYKQVLWQTSQGDVEAAKQAVAQAQAALQPLLLGAIENPPAAYDEPEYLVDALTLAAGRLQLVGLLLDQGETMKAHEVAEAIRSEFRELREGHGIYCLNDKLTHYHEVMEEVVLSAKDATDGVSDELVALWQGLLPELRSRWAASMALVQDDAPSRLRALMQGEADAIEILVQALEGTDRGAMRKAGLALKPAFAKVFLGVD